MTDTTGKAVAQAPNTTIAAVRRDLDSMEAQFKFALPAHIPVERFKRVVMTAVQNNPILYQKCTRGSLFNSCMKCAQDGLLPDGREAAIAPYKDKDQQWQAQYLPMIAGVRKKVRNSGLLSDWNVQVVQEGDQFEFRLGDDPFIHHAPAPKGGRTRPVLWAYSIATYPDGTKSREVMNIDQIEEVRKSSSKTQHGPWQNPVFYPEMCRKTVAKLHAKQLPMSTDLDTLLRRDDELYDFKAARERGEADQGVKPPPSVSAALDAFGRDEVPPMTQDVGQEDAEVASSTGGVGGGGADAARVDPGDQGQDSAASEATPAEPELKKLEPLAVARQRGFQAQRAGHMRKAVPVEYREPQRQDERHSWETGWDEAKAAAKGASGPLLTIVAALAILSLMAAPGLARHRHHPGPGRLDTQVADAGIAPAHHFGDASSVRFYPVGGDFFQNLGHRVVDALSYNAEIAPGPESFDAHAINAGGAYNHPRHVAHRTASRSHAPAARTAMAFVPPPAPKTTVVVVPPEPPAPLTPPPVKAAAAWTINGERLEDVFSCATCPPAAPQAPRDSGTPPGDARGAGPVTAVGDGRTSPPPSAALAETAIGLWHVGLAVVLAEVVLVLLLAYRQWLDRLNYTPPGWRPPPILDLNVVAD